MCHGCTPWVTGITFFYNILYLLMKNFFHTSGNDSGSSGSKSAGGIDMIKNVLFRSGWRYWNVRGVALSKRTGLRPVSTITSAGFQSPSTSFLHLYGQPECREDVCPIREAGGTLVRLRVCRQYAARSSSIFFRKITMAARAAWVMPEILPACPMETGWIFVSLYLSSFERLGIAQ